MTASAIRLSAGQPESPFPSRDLGRRIRVVFFGGAFLEAAALEFLEQLISHPEVDMVGGFCQSSGFGLRHMVADIARRRGFLTPAVLAVYGCQSALRFAGHPIAHWRFRQRAHQARSRLIAVHDVHVPAVVQQVRELAPDLGLVYGSPLLRPELFEIPAFGTLGIHHGKLPAYRGKKLTFWAMLNDDATTGVTIQRISAGVDTGDIVSAGEVAIRGRRYGRVDAEVQSLGVRLYLDAVVAVKRGVASCRTQPAGVAALYRQPGPRELLRLWLRRRAPRPASGPRGGASCL